MRFVATVLAGIIFCAAGCATPRPLDRPSAPRYVGEDNGLRVTLATGDYKTDHGRWGWMVDYEYLNIDEVPLVIGWSTARLAAHHPFYDQHGEPVPRRRTNVEVNRAYRTRFHTLRPGESHRVSDWIRYERGSNRSELNQGEYVLTLTDPTFTDLHVVRRLPAGQDAPDHLHVPAGAEYWQGEIEFNRIRVR